MKSFAALVSGLEKSSSNFEVRRQLCRDYFSSLDSKSSLTVVRLLLGKQQKAVLSAAQLKLIACKAAGIDEWLYDESYRSVGEHAETVALILPRARYSGSISLEDCLDLLSKVVSPIQDSDSHVEQAWSRLSEYERLLFNKMLLGKFAVNGIKPLLISALSELFNLPPLEVACKLESEFLFSAISLEELMEDCRPEESINRPYGFCETEEISPEQELSHLNYQNLSVEWKWQGIKVQLVKRNNNVHIWSSEFENLNSVFPELLSECAGLADGTVLEGAIVAYKDADVLPKSFLLARMKRKNQSRQIIQETPVVLMAYDLLEENGESLLSEPLAHRKSRLSQVLINRKMARSESEFQQLSLFAPCQLQLSTKLKNSPSMQVSSEQELRALLADVRMMKASGLVLKECEAPYSVSDSSTSNRPWKSLRPAPILIKAVLVAAQADEGKRNCFSDYTLAVWKDEELVSVVRATAELPDEDMCKVDKFVQQNVVGRFGPVLSVKPQLVFELSCDGLSKSSRHKSGLVLKRPRILRLCPELNVSKADMLENISQHCDV